MASQLAACWLTIDNKLASTLLMLKQKLTEYTLDLLIYATYMRIFDVN